jgi:hypothetical protein
MFLAKGVKEMVREYFANGHDIVVIAEGIVPLCRQCMRVDEESLQVVCVNAQ